MSFIKLLVLGIISGVFNTVANALWKIELTARPIDFSSFSKIMGTMFSVNILIGGFLYFTSMIMFFFMLSNYKLSIVIPVTSLTYILNLVSAYFIFHESFSPAQIIGSILIGAGIILISQSPVQSHGL